MSAHLLEPQAIAAFREELRQAVYDVIALRRDVRHFRADVPVAPEALTRILGAAHQAPSVGFSQPWGFVLVRDPAVRGRIRDSFLLCRQAEAARFPPDRRSAYLAHKLEGILEAPLNVCVAVDLRPQGEAILGTTVQPEAVRASACCAVQNLWLAARAEGIGVGWVSIVEPAVLRAELALPPGVEPVAYLCLGHPVAFREKPMLEETGWRPRRPLDEVVHAEDRWQDRGRGQAQLPPGGDAVTPPAPALPAPDARAAAAAAEHQARLTKPAGSLGRLEELGAFFAAATGRFPAPAPARPTLGLFAADHGVVVEAVSAYGSGVTAAMVANVMAGGAAINALAAACGVELALVDVGVAGDLSAVPRAPRVPLQAHRIRPGTANLRRAPAMSRAECEAAMAVGERIATAAIEGGAELLGVGEIGIGNTTAAAALVCAFTGREPAAVVGRGTGVDDAGRARKIAVVADALALHAPATAGALDTLAALGGLEIAAITGFLLGAARRRVPVVLDGLVSNAAALAGEALAPGLRAFLLASHRSPEPGAAVALGALELRPLLELEMRLGEGTGAVLGMHLVRAAVAAQAQMATFATAGVVR